MQLLFAASLQPRFWSIPGAVLGRRGGGCGREREGVEQSPRGARGAFFPGACPGASRLEPWLEAQLERIPKSCLPRPPVAGKGLFLSWRGEPTPPPPARASRQAGGEGEAEGRRSCRSWALAGAGGGESRLAPLRAPGLQVAETGDGGFPGWERSQVSLGERVQVERATQAPRSFSLEPRSGWAPPAGPALARPQRRRGVPVSFGSLSPSPAAVQPGKGTAGHYSRRWHRASCQSRPWGAPGFRRADFISGEKAKSASPASGSCPDLPCSSGSETSTGG